MVRRLVLAMLISLITASMTSTVIGYTTPPYSIDFDLRDMIGFSDNTISAEDIVAYIQKSYPNSPLLNKMDIGNCFINAGQNNNVNPAFLVATAELEGRFGTAGWAISNLECHNTLGYDITDTGPGSYSCAESWCAMIQRVASVIAHGSNYYTQGRYTIRDIRQKYATSDKYEPVSATTIADLMNELYSFSQTHDNVIESYSGTAASDVLDPSLVTWISPNAGQPTQVTLTLYVHEGSASGPIIPGAQVRVDDSNMSYQPRPTNSQGYFEMMGDPGIWHFEAFAGGYETNSWDQEITEDGTRHTFLTKLFSSSTQSSESSVVGKWRFNNPNCIYGDSGHECASPYIITFKEDGTWINDEGDTGNWLQNGNTVRFLSNDVYYEEGESVRHCYPYAYEGIIYSNTMNGGFLSSGSCDQPASLADTTLISDCPENIWNAERVGTEDLSAGMDNTNYI